MYSTCLFCNARLGANAEVESFPVGRRLAFDTRRGRLWVVCTTCARWNLSPLDERWEAIEECERRFHSTRLRVSTDNVTLARLPGGLELVRIGEAQRSEIAAWRYGEELRRRVPILRRAAAPSTTVTRATARVGDVLAELLREVTQPANDRRVLAMLRVRLQSNRVLDRPVDDEGRALVIRYAHLTSAELLRPEHGSRWQLRVAHDAGVATLSGETGLHSVAKLLAAVNRFGGTAEQVAMATAKLEDAGNPDGYFARVVGLALRTSWGLHPEFIDVARPPAAQPASLAERLAMHINGRTFWARGALGSAPEMRLVELPPVDLLALEMAANEDAERRAMEGELANLARAWREAEEIAAIADEL